MPEGVQRFQRTKMVLPCRVWLDEQENTEASPLQLAHTLDISPIGGRLGGLRTPVEVGQTITLQRGQKKTHVRVIWTKQLAPMEIQAGFETLGTAADRGSRTGIGESHTRPSDGSDRTSQCSDAMGGDRRSIAGR